MAWIELETADDPRIEPYRWLRDRDHATRADGRPGTFVVEGEVVLRQLLSPASRFRARSVLLSTQRAAALRDLLAARGPGIPVYVAPPALMTEIAGFPLHRGILALGERPTRPAVALPPSGPSLALGLIGLANHDNVGAAFRNAAAFAADGILLDSTSCDPLYRKAIRVSVGAALLIPFQRGGTADTLVEGLSASGHTLFAMSPAGREDLAGVDWPARTALVLGAEGPGLPKRLLDRFRTVRIPMAPGFDSLNVATAAGIALHAVGRASPFRDRLTGGGSRPQVSDARPSGASMEEKDAP